MGNFLRVPVDGEILGPRFVHEDRTPITAEEASELANRVNTAVEMGHAAIWINPETDSRQLHVAGQPVVLEGQALRYASTEEMAFFPRS